MFKFKNLLNPLQKVETYDVFSDYLKSDTLPIYQETEAGLQPLHIGNVPRIIEQSEDANNVTITIKYPFIPLIREYKKDHQIQFNGTDIYLSKHKATEENLYIPLTVIIHFAGQSITSYTTHRVLVEYGETQIQHIIPCQEISERVASHQIKKHPVLKDEHNYARLKVSHWRFMDGELHIYTTLVSSIMSKLKNGVQELNIRYTPKPVFITEDGNKKLQLHIDRQEAEQIISQMVQLDKYKVDYRIINENGLDTILITKEVKPECFPDEYEIIKPFAEYLNDLGYFVDDELLYDYFEQAKYLGGVSNG